jgi:Zn-dependent peptidase ImmA (M78 family)/DNA-binding XRE family transcriptional regulator
MTAGERIIQLREMHKLTQFALAEKIPQLTQSRLSRIEKGKAELDSETAALIAANTGVTSDFLFRESTTGLVAHSPQFRARSSLTEKVRSSAIQWADLIDEEYQRILANTGRFPVRVSALHGVPAHEAAQEVRRWLDFGPESPLPYLALAVERLGVVVIGLPVSEQYLDGFCAWRGDIPVIALLAGVPGDRLRFTLAHELGHLILHQTGQAGKEVETEADRFAAELLTPLRSIRNDFPSRLTLNSLIMLKTRWGVSLRSLIRRARELDLIDQDRAISLYKQISSRGWNHQEPGHVPIEKPRGFRKVAEMRYGNGPNIELMTNESKWSTELTFMVLDRHARADELPFVPDEEFMPNPRTDNVVSLHARRAQYR